MDFEKSIYRDICTFESQIDSICFSSYVTESTDNAASDNIFIQLANKVKSIINTIVSKIQNLIGKILGSSSISEESHKRIGAGLDVIKQAASKNANFAKEVNVYLSAQNECYSSAKKYVVIHSANIAKMNQLIESGIRHLQGNSAANPASKDEIKKLALAASKLETPADYAITRTNGVFTLESMFNIYRQKIPFKTAQKGMTTGQNIAIDNFKKNNDMEKKANQQAVEDLEKLNGKISGVFGPLQKVYTVINGARRLSNIIAGIKINRQAKQQRDIAVQNVNTVSKQVANITSIATATGAKLTKAEKEAYDHDYKVLVAFVNKFEPKARQVLGNANDANTQLEDRKKFAENQIKTKKDIRREKRQGKFEKA